MAKNLATLRVFGLEDNSNQEAHSRRQAEVVTKKKLIWRGLLPTLIFYLGSTLVSIVGFAVYLSLGGVLSVEKIFSTFLVLKIIEEPLSSYAGFFISLARAKASFVRLKDMNPSERTRKIHAEMRDEEIHLSGMAPVRVRRGQTIGIVGETGSGKSTLLKALFEGLAPVATCHFVGQQPFVFEGTLRDNVLLGIEREDCDLLDLLGRCQLGAGRQNRNHVEMAIGEMGCNLSGGERQRVALARALASSAEIFFLDDALSAMDQRTRSLVGEELLGRAWHDKTVFLVSSQFAELARCDFYLYTENGRCECLSSLAEVETRIPILRPEMNRVPETETQVAAQANAEIAKPEFDIWASLRTYFAHIDNSKRFPWRISLLIVVSALTTFAGSLQNLWLSVWSSPSHATGAARWLLLSAAKLHFNPHSSFQGLGVYTLLGLIFLFTVATRVIFWEFSAIEAASRILCQAVNSVLKAKCRAVERIGTSQLTQRLSDDFNSVDDVVSASLEESFSAFLALLTCLATICIVAHLALIPVIAMAFAWVYVFNSYLLSQKSLREMWIESKGKWLGHLRLLEENSEAVEQTGARKFIRARLYKEFERYQSISLGQNTLGRWFYGLSPLVASVIFMCTLAITILSGMSGAVSALVITFSIQQWMLLNWMARTLTGVQAYGMSLHRLTELERLPEESSQQKIKHEIGGQNRIEFRGVTLGYDRPVIEVEDFSLKQGELLFIHGRTGSGKSTLIKSLIGFSEVMAGTLNFNGLPVAGQANLRSLCAYVAQDPVILAGTVATNLAPLADVNENELWDCLETVQLARRVRSDTLQLNMSAHDLSQGERQLLCLARALLMKRPILILDEVSAQVDVNTEEEIVRVIQKIKPNFIVISISHRELLQKAADKSVHVSDARAVLQA